MTTLASTRIGATLAVIALLTPLTACGTETEATEGSQTPRAGGTLRLAIAKEPECLDPQQSPTAAARLLGRPLVDSLVHQRTDGRIEPWLATKWTVSPDKLTYTFTLRENVTFADGTKFDAASVVTNLDRVVAPATKSLLAASLISAYGSSRAIDPKQVEVRLERPDSTFLSALATPNLGVQSPATLTGDNAGRCATVIGTGPFRSERGLEPQKGIDYVRNPDYAWAPDGASHPGPAWLDRIQVQIAPDDTARYGALTSGQVDAITRVSPTKTRELDALPGFDLTATPYPGINYSYWPNTAGGPFADVRVRTAFRVGVDWARIVENVYFGAYPPARNVLSSSTPGYDRSVEQRYRHDPAEANRLLDTAGWATRDAAGYRVKDGKRLTVRHMWSDPSVSDLATQVQAAAKTLGVETVEENLDGGTFVNRLLAGDYDLIDTSFSAPGPQVLQELFGTANIPTPTRGISNNMARYDEPAVQELFRQALDAPDQAVQFAAYAKAQQLIAEDAAVFPIYSDLSTLGARTSVRQVTFDSAGTLDLHAVWLAS